MTQELESFVRFRVLFALLISSPIFMCSAFIILDAFRASCKPLHFISFRLASPSVYRAFIHVSNGNGWFLFQKCFAFLWLLLACCFFVRFLPFGYFLCDMQMRWLSFVLGICFKRLSRVLYVLLICIHMYLCFSLVLPSWHGIYNSLSPHFG